MMWHYYILLFCCLTVVVYIGFIFWVRCLFFFCLNDAEVNVKWLYKNKKKKKNPKRYSKNDQDWKWVKSSQKMSKSSFESPANDCSTLASWKQHMKKWAQDFLPSTVLQSQVAVLKAWNISQCRNVTKLQFLRCPLVAGYYSVTAEIDKICT